MLTTEQALRLAKLEIERLRRENTQLRKKVAANGRHVRRVDRAYADALLLAQLHIGYSSTSRGYVQQAASMSQRRWQNAIGLLKLARVHDGRSWQCHDLLTIETRLNTAVEKAILTPAAYHARLNKHARK